MPRPRLVHRDREILEGLLSLRPGEWAAFYPGKGGGAGIQRLQLDLEFREGGIYITDTRSLKDSDYPWIKSFHKQASEKLSYTEVTQRCRGKKIPCGIIIIVKDQKPHTSSPLGAG